MKLTLIILILMLPGCSWMPAYRQHITPHLGSIPYFEVPIYTHHW